MKNYVVLTAGFVKDSAEKTLAAIPELRQKKIKEQAECYRESFEYKIASFFRKTLMTDDEAAEKYRGDHFIQYPYDILELELTRILKMASLYSPQTEILMSGDDAINIQMYQRWE